MDTITSAPTRQRKARPSPQRHVSLEVRPEDGGLGIVRITVGKRRDDYFLSTVPADFGRAFRVEKIDLQANAPPYHVNINGDKRSCECKGFLHHGHCEHAGRLAALIAAGRL